MTFLRFSPGEYLALSHFCRPLNLNRVCPHTLKRLLVTGLAERFPTLAERLARLRGGEMRILQDYFRKGRQTKERHGLTTKEFGMLAAAQGSFLFQARFLRPLRHVVVRHFRESCPELVTKLEQLSHREFELLWEQVQERTRRGP